MTDIQKRLNHIRYCIEDARSHNGLYSSNHTELEWLVEQVEKVERYEKALEEIYSIAKFMKPELVPNEVQKLAWEEIKDKDFN